MGWREGSRRNQTPKPTPKRHNLNRYRVVQGARGKVVKVQVKKRTRVVLGRPAGDR